MVYIFTFFIIAVIGFIFYRVIKNEELPSNRYTPDDDITFGRVIDYKQDIPIHDTKHHVEYEETPYNEKNV